jgi:hypothetical protein
MIDSNEVIVIDLQFTRTTDELLDLFGAVFEFGGPNDRNPDRMVSADQRGWGRNLAALNDCLSCLDSGGIWGTSRKVRFPLTVEISNWSAYQSANPGEWETLLEILESKRDMYKRHGMSFQYSSL